jgi:hypothetical protein
VRERALHLCRITYRNIHHSIHTTVGSIYGDQQAGRVAYNFKDRQGKAHRRVPCFIDETKEYVLGKLGKGDVVGRVESSPFIARIKSYLPGCLKKVLLREDREFSSCESLLAPSKARSQFTIANNRDQPPSDPRRWYQPRALNPTQYNSFVYQPTGGQFPCRFVPMRLPKKQSAASSQPIQGELFEEDRYAYRLFCTSFHRKAYKIIAKYDKTADEENLTAEAKSEELAPIPSAKFKNNNAVFQIVILAYNLWRYCKLLAQKSTSHSEDFDLLRGIQDNTIRTPRLKILLVAARLVFHNNRDQLKFSIYDTRIPSMLRFLRFPHAPRAKVPLWIDNPLRRCRLSFNHP